MLVSEAVDRTLNNWLYPAGVDRPEYDLLSGSLTDSATSFSVTGRLGNDAIPDNTILEIGSELILVQSVATLAVTVNERGYLETTQAAHASGAKVWVDPDYPRRSIFNAIVSVIEDLAGLGLYKISSDTFTLTQLALVATDAGTKDVISPMVYTLGTETYELHEGRDYDALRAYDPLRIRFTSGLEGRTVTAMVKSEFAAPATEADDLTTVCGVPSSLSRHIPMAAAAHLLMGHEPSRLQIETIRRQLGAESVPVGSNVSVATALQRRWEEQVVRERMKQVATVAPTRIVV